MSSESEDSDYKKRSEDEESEESEEEVKPKKSSKKSSKSSKPAKKHSSHHHHSKKKKVESSEEESEESEPEEEPDSENSGDDGEDGAIEGPEPYVEDTEHYLTINVTEPTKQGEGVKAYVTYKVVTSTNLPNYQYGSYSVVRRYSDFVWLYEALLKEKFGYIIPPMPEKMAIGRFSPEFVESRRRGLESFLANIAQHYVLKKSKKLSFFLTASESSFGRERDKSKIKLDTDGALKVMGLIGKGLKNVTNKAMDMVQKNRTESSGTEDDMEFLAIVEQINNSSVQIAEAQKAIEIMCLRQRELYTSYSTYAEDFKALSQIEDEKFGIIFHKMGKSLRKMADLQKERAIKEKVLFQEPFKEYVLFCGAALKAIKQREEKAVVIENAREQLHKAKVNHAKLLAAGAPSSKKRESDREIKRCKKDVQKAIKSIEGITNIVKSEIKRFNGDRLKKFRTTILNFITVEMEYNQKFETLFSELKPDVDAPNIEEVAEEYATKAGEVIEVPEEEVEKEEDRKRREKREKRKEKLRKEKLAQREKERKEREKEKAKERSKKSKSKPKAKPKPKKGKGKKKVSESESETESETPSESGSDYDSESD